MLGVLLTFGIAFALVVAQALLVQGQQRLDGLDERISTATEAQQELRLRVAELESPARVVAAASALGMVPPEHVTYLTPSPIHGVGEG
jgi:cell division protein FtsL